MMDTKEHALKVLNEAAHILGPQAMAMFRALLDELDICDEVNEVCRCVLADLIDATPMTTNLTLEEIADFLLDGKAVVYRGDFFGMHIICVRQLGHPDLCWIVKKAKAA
jgi:hypothetical protein